MKGAAKPAAAPAAPAKPAGSDGAIQGPKTAEEVIEEHEKEERSRLITYLVIKWILEILCAILVVLTTLWLTFQGTKIINLLGVSDIPPGLVYGISFPPDPPPTALSPPPPSP